MKKLRLGSLLLNTSRIQIYVIVACSLFSCKNDPTPEVPVGAEGYFVVNEGAFNGSNTSISFYDRKSETMTNNVFSKKNGRPLGDQAQSATVFENKAYVVVQHSSKVEVIDPSNFESLGTISGLESPRYFIGINATKGYVSDWGADGVSGSIKVIDLTTMKVTKSVSLGSGPNRMILKDGLVYVALNGGFGKDTRVMIINSANEEVQQTLNVDDNPNSLQFDQDGNLWVACGGALAYNDDFTIDEAKSTKPSLIKLDGSGKVLAHFVFEKITYTGLGSLEMNATKDQLYFLYDDAVYTIGIHATTAPTSPLINKTFYGLAFDPFANQIIGCEALNFSSPGKIYLYDVAGKFLTSMEVGIAPNGIAFK